MSLQKLFPTTQAQKPSSMKFPGRPREFNSQSNQPNRNISDMETDKDGNLAILGCDGSFFKFSKNGLKTLSYNSILENSKFLVSINNDWLIMNNNGVGKTIRSERQIEIPKSSLPIVDIESIESSIAILTIDHILILNVK